ncbi:hypothetical protein O1611_g5570 [Lasiodiplodia mahajangana]|uniref:Uncharacterized protein n=1 Tax=Lasiodiplodia mahajangana TaxID=1108764 RepID=A0ACC2JL33_9PEZI|nr:hypothetical protein O1611_g5570 [Lasiodiplodia mahajangana]
MSSGTDCLCIALYARGRESKGPDIEDKYHWALIVAPKTELDDQSRSIRFHAKQTPSAEPPHLVWRYEEERLDIGARNILLTRVVIGNVLDMGRLRSIFANIPVRPDVPNWNCVGWVREAVEAALKDSEALSSSITSWEAVKEKSLWYIQKKTVEHRFDGQGNFSGQKAATWDMLEDKEVIP